MICTTCGSANGPDDRFCEQCGTPLSAPPEGDGAGFNPTVMAGAGEPSVLVRQGPDGGQAHSLGPRVTVGRLDTCDLPIDDRSVSREHARFSRLRDGYVIEDLGSTNGTLVNGQRIHEAVLLRPGDLITIGSVEFLFDTAKAQSGAAGGSTPAPVVEDVEEVQTMHGLPPLPVDFPPFEPFVSSADSEVHAPEPAPPPPVLAPPVPEPHPASPPPMPAQSVPAQSVPAQSMLESSPSPWPPQPSLTPAPVAPQTGGQDVLGEAIAAARRLTELVDQLARQVDQAEVKRAQWEQERSDLLARQSRQQERIDSLEGIQRSQEAVKQALKRLPAPAMPSEQLGAIQDSLEALVQNPRDVEILLKLGQNAPQLATVVGEYAQIQRSLEQVTGALSAGATR